MQEQPREKCRQQWRDTHHDQSIRHSRHRHRDHEAAKHHAPHHPRDPQRLASCAYRRQRFAALLPPQCTSDKQGGKDTTPKCHFKAAHGIQMTRQYTRHAPQHGGANHQQDGTSIRV